MLSSRVGGVQELWGNKEIEDCEKSSLNISDLKTRQTDKRSTLVENEARQLLSRIAE
jgi:hypothetical protein